METRSRGKKRGRAGEDRTSLCVVCVTGNCVYICVYKLDKKQVRKSGETYPAVRLVSRQSEGKTERQTQRGF